MKTFLLFLITVLLAVLVLYEKPEQKSRHSQQQQALIPILPFEFEDDENPLSLVRAIDQSLRYYRRQPNDDVREYGFHEYRITQAKKNLSTLKNLLQEKGFSEEFYTYLQEHFVYYKVKGRPSLVTGYFEAHLNGSLKKSKRFFYPLYRRPPDLYQVSLKKFCFFEKISECS